MRSLWRMLALRWLGGHGSEALAGNSTMLEALMSGEERRRLRPSTCGASPEFLIRR